MNNVARSRNVYTSSAIQTAWFRNVLRSSCKVPLYFVRF